MSNDLRAPRASSARLRPLVLIALVLAAALSRLIPHPPNFTPIGAMALFGGAYFVSRLAAYAVPLAAMFVADAVFAATAGWAFGAMTLAVYACIAASVALGRGMRSRVRPGPVVARSLASASLFYAVTNFAVWLGGGFYPRTGDGLIACYVAAIPFFGNTLAGYAVFGTVLFGGFELLQRRVELLSPAARARA